MREVTLDSFRGLACAGGFSFADCLGSATGWCATIVRDESLRAMFARFFARTDAFAIGICTQRFLSKR